MKPFSLNGLKHSTAIIHFNIDSRCLFESTFKDLFFFHKNILLCWSEAHHLQWLLLKLTKEWRFCKSVSSSGLPVYVLFQILLSLSVFWQAEAVDALESYNEKDFGAIINSCNE